ncbi:unnamed protein product [Amoebophrya sp. A120]|nr:unnamed protein product [Amoebophrya sp. A120]|eukprot:GSA120T00001439001.1
MTERASAERVANPIFWNQVVIRAVRLRDVCRIDHFVRFLHVLTDARPLDRDRVMGLFRKAVREVRQDAFSRLTLAEGATLLKCYAHYRLRSVPLCETMQRKALQELAPLFLPEINHEYLRSQSDEMSVEEKCAYDPAVQETDAGANAAFPLASKTEVPQDGGAPRHACQDDGITSSALAGPQGTEDMIPDHDFDEGISSAYAAAPEDTSKPLTRLQRRAARKDQAKKEAAAQGTTGTSHPAQKAAQSAAESATSSAPSLKVNDNEIIDVLHHLADMIGSFTKMEYNFLDEEQCPLAAEFSALVQAVLDRVSHRCALGRDEDQERPDLHKQQPPRTTFLRLADLSALSRAGFSISPDYFALTVHHHDAAVGASEMKNSDAEDRTGDASDGRVGNQEDSREGHVAANRASAPEGGETSATGEGNKTKEEGVSEDQTGQHQVDDAAEIQLQTWSDVALYLPVETAPDLFSVVVRNVKRCLALDDPPTLSPSCVQTSTTYDENGQPAGFAPPLRLAPFVPVSNSTSRSAIATSGGSRDLEGGQFPSAVIDHPGEVVFRRKIARSLVSLLQGALRTRQRSCVELVTYDAELCEDYLLPCIRELSPQEIEIVWRSFFRRHSRTTRRALGEGEEQETDHVEDNPSASLLFAPLLGEACRKFDLLSARMVRQMAGHIEKKWQRADEHAESGQVWAPAGEEVTDGKVVTQPQERDFTEKYFLQLKSRYLDQISFAGYRKVLAHDEKTSSPDAVR